MKEQDVEKLATLLNKSQEEVSTALENGGISDFINEFESSHKIMPTADFETFKTNFEAQVEKSVEQKWLDTKVPKVVYDKIKGTVLEMQEKTLAEKYNVKDYNGLDDLVAKIKPAKNPEDVNEYKRQIDTLTESYTKQIDELKAKSDKRFIDFHVNNLINQVPIDAEGEVLDNQRKVLRTLVMDEFKFSVEDEAFKIEDAPVKFKQDNLDPRDPLEVMTDYAKPYIPLASSASGGRGDISSTRSATSRVSISEFCEKNGIRPNTPEHAKAIKDFKEKGIEIVE